MANEEHLKILKQGVEVWNKWRKENPEIEPDLREAILSGVNLSRADLSWADLSRADLQEACLTEADLHKANISSADLRFVNLEMADLNRVNLRKAKLFRANLRNPRCIPQELKAIVEQLPSLPVKPLLKHGSKPWGMYDHIKRYPWVLEIFKYRDVKALLVSLTERVIAPAEEKWLELNQKG